MLVSETEFRLLCRHHLAPSVLAGFYYGVTSKGVTELAYFPTVCVHCQEKEVSPAGMLDM